MVTVWLRPKSKQIDNPLDISNIQKANRILKFKIRFAFTTCLLIIKGYVSDYLWLDDKRVHISHNEALPNLQLPYDM